MEHQIRETFEQLDELLAGLRRKEREQVQRILDA